MNELYPNWRGGRPAVAKTAVSLEIPKVYSCMLDYIFIFILLKAAGR